MNTTLRGVLIGACVVAMTLTSACSAIEGVARPVNRGGSQNSAARLWPDVPALAGADTVELDLPLLLRLALYSAASDMARDSNLKLNGFDFVIHRAAVTPAEVQLFYTAERMADAGWNAEKQPGCTQTASLGGLLCTFARSNGDRHTALFIVAGYDATAASTHIYYVRFESARAQQTPTPAP